MMMRRALAMRRGVHQMVFIEDHNVVTDSRVRTEHLRQCVDRIGDKLKKDTCTVVKLNTGYGRKNKVMEFSKGKFNAEEAVKLDGRKGATALWSNVLKAVDGQDVKEMDITVLTNGGDDLSKNPMKGERGLEGLVKQLTGKGVRFSTWVIGLDVNGVNEREAMANACNWTGGRALFLDCDGRGNDGTTLCSSETESFFSAFRETDPKVLINNAAASKKAFASTMTYRTTLTPCASHATPVY